jgi:hypothetical protein
VWIGHALHEEAHPRGAVRVALHDHGAVAQVRQQRGCDVGVVLEQVALRDATVTPEQLVEVRELDPLASDRQLDVGLVLRNRDRTRGSHGEAQVQEACSASPRVEKCWRI